MRYEKVKVTRDTNTVHNREVPPWEVPILEYLFEEGRAGARVPTEQRDAPEWLELVGVGVPAVQVFSLGEFGVAAEQYLPEAAAEAHRQGSIHLGGGALL